MLILKRGIIILSVVIVAALFVLGLRVSARFFPVKSIVVSGNYHLEDAEVREALNIRDGENLFSLSADELETRFKYMKWVKNVTFRKHFPDTLMVRVEEASPVALLRLNKHMFLIDTAGNVLEEIANKSTLFLPVIIGVDPIKDRGGVLEALELIKVLTEQNILSNRESVEIKLKTYGLELNLEGDPIKVGFGGYSKKINRWKELEAEIRKKDIEISYVDLRFEDKVIVKPKKKGKERR